MHSVYSAVTAYELRQCMSEGAEPDARHRPYKSMLLQRNA